MKIIGKMYVRKLLSMLLFFVAWIIAFVVLYPLTGSLSNFFWYNEVIRLSISGVPPFLVVLYAVTHGRVGLRVVRSEYLSAVSKKTQTCKKSCLYLLKMPEFRCEILAFSTYMLPFVCAIAIANPASFLPKLFAAIILFLILVLIYALLNALLWAVVFGIWNRKTHPA